MHIAFRINEYEIGTKLGSIGNAKLKIGDPALLYSIHTGDNTDIYLLGVPIFEGIVRFVDWNVAVGLVYIAGEEDIFQRQFIRRKVFPSDVGKTDSMDIADVVRFIVDNYSSFTYDDNSIKDTGYKISKFVISDRLGNTLNKLAQTVGYTWYVQKGKFYFVPSETYVSPYVITNTNAHITNWAVLSDVLYNDIHVFGASVELKTVDYFIGDGTTTEFKLSYVPNGDVRVWVEDKELDRSEYEILRDEQIIKFKQAPPKKTVNLSVLPQWQWRRPITISGGSNGIDNPVVFIKLNESNFDFSKVKPDFSDVRFADLSSGTEYPWVFLGKDADGNSVFAVKVNKNIAANTSYTFYMFYGNPNATKPSYQFSDVLSVADEFNYNGELNSNAWDIETYWTAAPSMTWKYQSVASGYAYIEVDVSEWDFTSQSREVRVTAQIKVGKGMYVYWYEQGDDTNKHIGLNMTTAAPYFNVGYLSHYDKDTDQQVVTKATDGGSVVLRYGVYYADPYINGPTIGDEEVHAGYNVKVQYTMFVRIYAHMRDEESVSKYGVLSQELRLDWIRDFDTATLVASKYLQSHKDVHYKCEVRMGIGNYVRSGIRPRFLVWVDDKIHGFTRLMRINELNIRNGIVQLALSEVIFNVYDWGSFIEYRLKQLETAGDENFFTPQWLK